jgi:acetyl-CoA acetyltransferase family protein
VPEAVIVDAVRTPIGRYAGVLSSVCPDDLAARAIEACLARSGLPGELVDDVFLGCTNAAVEDNRNRRADGLVARRAAGRGARGHVNRLCASGLVAVSQAARAIRTGEAQAALAGGVESMSRSPFVALKPERSLRAATWSSSTRRSAGASSTRAWPSGIRPSRWARRRRTSPTVTPCRARIRTLSPPSRTRRAVAAAEGGRFDDELVTVDAPRPKSEPATVHADEGPRRDADHGRLATLRPAFRAGGTVTAGNSSSINDGAACLALCSEEGAAELGLDPLARVVATAAAGVDPAYMGIGPIPATRSVLARAGLSVTDLDLVELNEAFAAQVLACVRELDIDVTHLNVNGGAIALGHPLGCSGARILATLCWELRRRGDRYGLATMCVGVGQGLAMVVESGGD